MSPSARAPAEEGARSRAREAATPKSQHKEVNEEMRGSLFPSIVGFVGDAELHGQPCPPQMLPLSSHGSVPEVIDSSWWEMNTDTAPREMLKKSISVRMRRAWDHLALAVL